MRISTRAGALAIAIGLLTAGGMSAHAEGGSVEGTFMNPWLLRDQSFVIYLEGGPDILYDAPETPPALNQAKMTFVPHVIPMVVGWELEMQSADPFLHNVHTYYDGGTLFNVAMPPVAGLRLQQPIDDPGVINILCDVHQEMSAFIVAVENPFFAVVPDPKATAEKAGPEVLAAAQPFLEYMALLHGVSEPLDGEKPVVGFTISDVPAGEYELAVWGEKLNDDQLENRIAVTVKEGEVTTVTVKP